MRCYLVLASLALAAGAAGARNAPRGERDLHALEGVWALTAFAENGREEADDLTRTYRVLIRGSSWTARFLTEPPSALQRSTIRLDGSKRPREITLQTRDRKPAAGIYALERDTLRLCLAHPGTPRPSEFRTRPQDGRVLLTLRRLPSVPARPTRATLRQFLVERFNLSFPDTARVTDVAAQLDPVTRGKPAREVFARVTLPAAEYGTFRRRLLFVEKRPPGQQLTWQGKENPAALPALPGPDSVLRIAAGWWTRGGADTVCVLSNELEGRHFPSGSREETFIEQTGAVTLFLSERKRQVTLWAFVLDP